MFCEIIFGYKLDLFETTFFIQQIVHHSSQAWQVAERLIGKLRLEASATRPKVLAPKLFYFRILRHHCHRCRLRPGVSLSKLFLSKTRQKNKLECWSLESFLTSLKCALKAPSLVRVHLPRVGTWAYIKIFIQSVKRPREKTLAFWGNSGDEEKKL